MSSDKETLATECDQPQSDLPMAAGTNRVAVVGHLDGRPIGAPIYLTAAEIRLLGADPETAAIEYRVVDGELLLG